LGITVSTTCPETGISFSLNTHTSDAYQVLLRKSTEELLQYMAGKACDIVTSNCKSCTDCCVSVSFHYLSRLWRHCLLSCEYVDELNI